MSAQKFFNKAIGNNGKPELINIDKSGSNKSALWIVNKRSLSFKKIKIRQSKYLNNIYLISSLIPCWKVIISKVKRLMRQNLPWCVIR